MSSASLGSLLFFVSLCASLASEQQSTIDSPYAALISSIVKLRTDLKAWRESVPFGELRTIEDGFEGVKKRLEGLEVTAGRLKEELNVAGMKANEIYSLEDTQIRLLSNLTGKFAVLQSKIIHLDDENISDTVEAAFNKPSPRKNQIYESVLPTQANKSKEFATTLEGLMKKESNFVVIYVVLGVVRA